MATERGRDYSIDVLRIISALAVIIIHVVSSPVANYAGTVDATIENALQTVHALMNWSVPVFFMITGYCLLRKSECAYAYCFSRAMKYVAVLFTVGLSYALMEEIYTLKTFNVGIFAHSVRNVIAGRLWDHMWFVYAIIGIYLVMPVIYAFMKERENALILTSLLFCFTILFPFFEDYLPIGIDFPFGGYLFYVCFGALAATCKMNEKNLKLFVFPCVFAYIYIYICVLKMRNSDINTRLSPCFP